MHTHRHTHKNAHKDTDMFCKKGHALGMVWTVKNVKGAASLNVDLDSAAVL